MQTRDYSILDGDGHVFEWDHEIFEYMEPPYRDHKALLGFPFFPTLDGYHRGAITARLGIHPDLNINASRWLSFLDEVEIESTVLFPTAGLAFGMIQDRDWAVALARAYNNWFNDRYYSVDNRLRGVAIIPIQDVQEAVKEMHRAVKELHAAGIVIPANGAELGIRKPLGHPDFWPIYEAAEELDRPIAIHGAPSQNLGINFFDKFALTQSLEHPLAQMIQMTSMVYEGVFERFKKLRVAYLEAGAGWVPYMMDRLDRTYEAYTAFEYREFSDLVKKRPSEYIASGNVYFSCEGDEESMGYAIERIGNKVLMFASDFPHETNAERCKHEIEEMIEREDLSAESKKGIFQDNMRAFYGGELAAPSQTRETATAGAAAG